MRSARSTKTDWSSVAHHGGVKVADGRGSQVPTRKLYIALSWLAAHPRWYWLTPAYLCAN